MFNLTRYFSTLSFIFIALASGLVGAYFENEMIRNAMLAVLTLLFLFQLFVVRRARIVSSRSCSSTSTASRK